LLERITAGKAPTPLEKMFALKKSFAVIEFALDGTIVDANENFLSVMGYTLAEIRGKHHSIFVPASERQSSNYREFWASLNRGEQRTAEFKRIAKCGKEIWIQASYSPIPGKDGRPAGVIKLATDITDRKIRSMEAASKIAAINRAQATIEFNLDGTIVTANDNFLNVMGYSLEEIRGKHHSMFVEPSEQQSTSYRDFWKKLGEGNYHAAEFKRIAKDGREVWILASYNPIFDDNGVPFKVVKYATDITEQKLGAADYKGQISAIGRSQAVIEFNMDGTVCTANDHFQAALGYSLEEIRGKHHAMFLPAGEADSEAYRSFWEALRRGEYCAGEFLRIGKGGRQVWIAASYNPILDMNGKPFKVVKYATDVTKRVLAHQRSEHVRAMMETVATGAEELSSSVQEISRAMSKSKEAADKAMQQICEADRQAHQLNSASEAMSGIVQVIRKIADQTNLLALNATIEASRAGDAGRGFGVVATEVKNLANEAKNATDKINAEIESMKEISTGVLGMLAAILSAMQHVSEYVTSTAAAVNQQSVVSRDMSSNMQKAAAEAASLG
jgi:methyl-accepting chemotaxis protein